jgi:biopolymer transport protein TolQ
MTGLDTPLGLILAGSVLTKAVLILLVLLSLMSWGIMFAKWAEYRRAERHGLGFLADFTHARSLDDAVALAGRAPRSPFTAVFSRALQFLKDTTPALAATSDRHARLSASQVEALRLVLDAESGAARDVMGRFVPWLATVGSVSPLIGLFGTVLGVISAFQGIAAKGPALPRRWWPLRRRWRWRFRRRSATTCWPTDSIGMTGPLKGSGRS